MLLIDTISDFLLIVKYVTNWYNFLYQIQIMQYSGIIKQVESMYKYIMNN
jgi:hypothetical protein